MDFSLLLLFQPQALDCLSGAFSISLSSLLGKEILLLSTLSPCLASESHHFSK